MKQTQCAGGVVLNKEGLVLIVNTRGNSWSLPKGHIDPGEDPLAAAKREIHEESGISQLDLVRYIGFYQRHKISLDGGDDPSEFKTIYIYLFTTQQQNLKPIDKDNPEARWVELKKVPDLLTHYKDKEFFRSVMYRGL